MECPPCQIHNSNPSSNPKRACRRGTCPGAPLTPAAARQARTTEVRIEDVDAATLRVLLQFCYAGLAQLPRSHAGVLAVFRAADKYDIPDLVAECVHGLEAITGFDDVAPLLQARHRCLPLLCSTRSAGGGGALAGGRHWLKQGRAATVGAALPREL